MNRVAAGFFSLTPPEAAADDGSYLRWHLLDHMPEQYSLPGIVHGMRWIADGDYPAQRISARAPLDDVGAAVNYLMAEPVQQTYDEFMALGAHLGAVGRFPQRRQSLQLRLLELLGADAAPRVQVSAQVVPFRPHRGVLLIVEEPAGDLAAWNEWLHREHLPAWLELPGVAGVWRYRGTDRWTVKPTCEGGPQLTTVVYLEADPLATSAAVAPLVEQRWASGEVRPLFAGPLRTMMQWDAWRD